jgi:hypothetical protein
MSHQISRERLFAGRKFVAQHRICIQPRLNRRPMIALRPSSQLRLVACNDHAIPVPAKLRERLGVGAGLDHDIE